MKELKVGQIVCSTAGHDKKQFYIIIHMEGEYVFLVDGNYKLLKHPKKKNKKHIQYIANVSEEWTDEPNDFLVKRILKIYKKTQGKKKTTEEQ